MVRYWKDILEYEQPDAASLKKKAKESAEREKKKGKILEPVKVSGRQIVQSWWGKAWCDNLERYADYASRLERGKRYVRTGTVVDLKINKGKVTARVQGRRRAPYKVSVRISPLSEQRCQEIIAECGNQIENVEQLLSGNIPLGLQELFTSKNGLFPSSREISFDCSCPDWALLCKHVAAVLYGIGVRFDENPLLFFTLRGIDVEKFVNVTLENRIEQMIKNADRKSERVMDDIDLEAVFGVR